MKRPTERLLALADLADVLSKHNLVLSHDLETVRIEQEEGGNSLICEGRKINALEVIRWATNEIRNAAPKDPR